MGKKLAESALIRDAAKASGLFADGISGFMNAALDNADCWWGMCDGLEYLINNPELRHFVCFHDRYIAERLLRFNDTFKEDLDAWYGIVRNLKKDFGDELRGY